MADTALADGFTRGPNWTYDLMPALSPAEYKVLSAAVRLTYGWHEEWTDASANTVAEMTGIARPTVATILNTFAAIGLIEREPGRRNSFRWKLSPVSLDDLSAKMTGHKSTCKPSLQLPVSLDDNYLSDKMTPYIRKKERSKKEKERESNAACAAPAAGQKEQAIGQPEEAAPVRQELTSQPARTPSPPVPPDPRSPEPVAEQPRLVDAEMPDPIRVYREVAGVKKPNQAQRDAIRRRVIGYPEAWREVCDKFARNGWRPQVIDNLLDAYDKAVIAEKRAAAAAERERLERERRERDRAPISDEERAENIRKLQEARQRFTLFRPATEPRRPPFRPEDVLAAYGETA